MYQRLRRSSRREFGLPVSGVTHWQRGRWVITLNASEPTGRVRFSLAHEFCHVLHHATRESFYWTGGAERAERLADYFAGCLLMPKRHVKRLSGEGLDAAQMARTFGVSLAAIRVRLIQLGLGEPTPRCSWPPTRSGSYFRTAAKAKAAA